MKLRVAKKIVKKQDELNYHKAQVKKAENAVNKWKKEAK